MYPYLKIGSLNIPLYTVMIVLGVIVGLFIAFFTVYKKEKMTKKTGLIVLIACLIGSLFMFLGAMFFDALFHSIKDGKIGLYGMTFLGAIVVAFPVAVFLFHKLVFDYKGKALYLLSIIVPCVVICHAFGRIGCFLGGCCYGIKTDSFLGVKFPFLDYKVLPTQLFEAVFELIFGIFLLSIKKLRGHELETWLIGYGVFRFIIEFFRGDDRGNLSWFISPGQILSIVCIVSGILLILFYQGYIFRRMYSKLEEYQNEVLIKKELKNEEEI